MNIRLNNLLKEKPFSLKKNKKDLIYFKLQKLLHGHHYKYCNEYKKISDHLFEKPNNKSNLKDMPFLHVNLFKKFDLKTKYFKDKPKTYSSSGSSGKKLSKISLDKKTSLLQSMTLKNIFSDLIEGRNSKILFFENEDILKTERKFTARGAAVSGFMQLVNHHYFILDKKRKIKINYLKKILRNHKNENIIFFGFTSDVWTSLIQNSNKNKIKFNKNNSILIHGGGWKKLENKNISKKKFDNFVKKKLGVKKIVNYYGMIEQTGSIYLECPEGYFHCSIFSDILVRSENLEILPNKVPGIIQSLSIIPLSYPGHNILTEDQGYILGVDDCKCGKLGKYFLLTNRVKGTEIRGCSDVYN